LAGVAMRWGEPPHLLFCSMQVGEFSSLFRLDQRK
jgi:hypothetical protein